MTDPLRLPMPRMPRWRRTRSRQMASYRVFDVCRVELEDGAGRSRGDAFTLRCPDWCNVIAVTPDEHVVMVWQYRFGTDALSLEIPGGVVDPGELPEQAARRELREETGYEVDDLESFTQVEPNPAVQDNRCFTFVGRGARPTDAARFDPQEELETVLVPAARIADLLDGGQVRHSLVQGALEAFWRRSLSRGAPQRQASWDEAVRLLERLEALERRDVLDLARRLRPGLTSEDIANPQDFPELSDPDWQHKQGVLTGVQSALAAVRARRRGDEG
ncbi:MAG TPA: NUDIX hydrolase [Polyangiaceae bacterium]|nr:NUDIX hydrolase [Polyangiaceae bacterium]